MFKVNVGNNVKKKTVIVDGGKTLRQILEENNVSYSGGIVRFNGESVANEELDNRLDDYTDLPETSSLFCAVHLENAGI